MNKIFISIITVVAIFTSCDPGTISTTSFKNLTDYPIEVVFYSTNKNSSIESKQIEPQSELVIWYDDALSSIGHIYLEELELDSLKISIPEVLEKTFKPGTSGKNPFNHDDWELRDKRKFPAGKSFYTVFEIEDQDIIDWMN